MKFLRIIKNIIHIKYFHLILVPVNQFSGEKTAKYNPVFYAIPSAAFAVAFANERSICYF